jgi:hypothetical protein
LPSNALSHHTRCELCRITTAVLSSQKTAGWHESIEATVNVSLYYASLVRKDASDESRSCSVDITQDRGHKTEGYREEQNCNDSGNHTDYSDDDGGRRQLFSPRTIPDASAQSSFRPSFRYIRTSYSMYAPVYPGDQPSRDVRFHPSTQLTCMIWPE